MKENIFPRFEPPVIEGLPERVIDQVIDFTRPAFGTSNWGTRASAQHKPYYFNLDQAWGSPDMKESGLFVDNLVQHIHKVIGDSAFSEMLGGQEPVLGYVYSVGRPTGIVQLRSAVSQCLDLASVLIFPDKRLLRFRVICNGDNLDFPESVKWLVGRHVLLLTDATATGEFLARAKGALRAFGASVLAAVAVYDREEGAADSLKRVDIALYPVYGADEFIKRRKHVTEDQDLVGKIRECTGRERVGDFSAVVANAS